MGGNLDVNKPTRKVEIPGLIAKQNLPIMWKKFLNSGESKKVGEPEDAYDQALSNWKSMTDRTVKEEVNAQLAQFTANSGILDYANELKTNAIGEFINAGTSKFHTSPAQHLVNPQPNYQIGIDPYNQGLQKFGGNTSIYKDSTMDFLQAFQNPRGLADMLSELYELPEKWSFLQTLGYQLQDNESQISGLSKAYREYPLDNVFLSLDECFKKEIIIKFKIMLLTKGTLKFKI